jgi:hypothetical protein
MMLLYFYLISFLSLILQAADQIGWKEAIQFGPTVVILFMILAFLIRMAPIWKEVRLREIEMRGEENVVKREMAGALGQLGNVLQVIAVEQRKATEEVTISQRVNASTAHELNVNVKRLAQHVEELDNKFESINSQKEKSEHG